MGTACGQMGGSCVFRMALKAYIDKALISQSLKSEYFDVETSRNSLVHDTRYTVGNIDQEELILSSQNHLGDFKQLALN